MNCRAFLSLSALACSFFAGNLRAQSNDATNKLARDIYKQLIEINTTDSIGGTTAAARRRLSAERCAGDWAKCSQGKPGGSPSRYRRAEADAPDLSPGCGGSAARRLVYGSVSIYRKGRLLLRPRIGRY